jgi:hypothetical protein
MIAEFVTARANVIVVPTSDGKLRTATDIVAKVRRGPDFILRLVEWAVGKKWLAFLLLMLLKAKGRRWDTFAELRMHVKHEREIVKRLIAPAGTVLKPSRDARAAALKAALKLDGRTMAAIRRADRTT